MKRQIRKDSRIDKISGTQDMLRITLLSGSIKKSGEERGGRGKTGETTA